MHGHTLANSRKPKHRVPAAVRGSIIERRQSEGTRRRRSRGPITVATRERPVHAGPRRPR